MDKLSAGVRRFAETTFSDEHVLFERLASGQAPDALFVTCSDSRVVPNLLTASSPGELFVLRNAGNLVPAHGAVDGGEAATVEYAVGVLGLEHIVVCGHSDCGAMSALLQPGSTDALPAIKSWLRFAEPTLQVVRASGYETIEARRKLAIEVNVVQQLANLRTHPSVAVALSKGTLALHGWVYDIGSGAVRAYDPQVHAFVPLGEASPATRAELNGLLGHPHEAAS